MIKYSVIIPAYNRCQEVKECIFSLMKTGRKDFEIIVVDDFSSDNTTELLNEIKINNLTIYKNLRNSGATVSRNNGAKKAKGEYLFLLDSDTEVDKNIFNAFDKAILELDNVGIIAPKIYYFNDKKRIWYAGSWINLLTSQAHYRGIDELDKGQFCQVIRLKGGHVPTAFLVPRELFFEVGSFDENLVIGFEEPFIAQEIEKTGKIIYFYPSAMLYHKIPLAQNDSNTVLGTIKTFFTFISFRNPRIAFYTSRNRVWFMKKYSKNYLLFLFFFLPLLNIIYLIKSIFSNNMIFYKQILKGSLDGILNKQRNYQP